MQAIWTSGGLWLGQTALAASLVMLLVLGWMRLLRQPARRQRLGEIGLAAALLASVAALGPAWLQLPWAPFAGPSPQQVDVRVDARPAQGKRVETPLNGSDNARWFLMADDRNAVAPVVEPAPADDGDGGGAAKVSLLPAILIGVLAVYLLGAAFFLTRWLFGYIALSRILRQAEPVPDEIRGRFLPTSDASQSPRLLMSHRLRAPVSCGIWKPTIILPVSMCKPPDHGRLPWVFAHEMTHLVRRDAWSSLLFALGQAIFFFLPWFWWLRRQVRLCQEYVADAVAAGERPADEYAEFLLSLLSSPAVPMTATGVSGNTSDLYRRVSMLLKSPMRVEKCCPRSWTWGIAAVLVAFAVVLGGVSLTAEAQGRIIIIETGDKPQADILKHVEGGAVKILLEKPGDRDVFLYRTEELPGKGKDILFKKFVGGGDRDVFLYRTEKTDKVPEKDAFFYKRVGGAGQPEVGREILFLRADKLPSGDVLFEKFIPHGELPSIDKLPGGVPGKGKVFQKQIIIDVEAGKDDGKGQEKDIAALMRMLERLGAKDLDKVRNQLEDVLKKRKDGAFELELKLKLDDLKKLQKGLGEIQIRPLDPIDLDKLKQIKEWKAKVLLPGENPTDKLLAERLVVMAGQAHGKLGIKLTKPSEIVAEQLNLPKGQGLVVIEIDPKLPGAKTGLKLNDIVLRVNGAAVADQPAKFHEQIAALKPDANIEIVVLRKGKEETLKGPRMSELLPAQADMVREKALRLSELVKVFPGGDGVMTTTFRKEDRFNTRHQEGSLIITVVGKLDGGKAVAQEIHIQDGTVSNKYDSADRVPAQYRDKVNHLIAISGGPVQVRKSE